MPKLNDVSVQTLDSIDMLLSGNEFNYNGLRYASSKSIVEPWLDLIEDNSTGRYKIEALVPDAVATEHDGGEYVFYPRFSVQSYLKPEFSQVLVGAEKADLVTGLICAFDTGVLKTWIGAENSACLNLCVFNPSWIKEVSFGKSNFQEVYESAREYMREVGAYFEQVTEAFRFLNAEQLTGESLDKVIGKVVRKSAGVPGFITSTNQGVGMLFNKKDAGVRNIYYREPGPSGQHAYTRWAIYNALTANLSRGFSTTDKPDKVLKVYQFFSEN